MKFKHDIFLDDIKSSKVTIKGNKLNLRWFDDCVIIFSEAKDDKRFLLELLTKLDLWKAYGRI